MRTYLDFVPENGYPSDDDLKYECMRCKGVVPSRPKHDVQCPCGEIRIYPETCEVKAGKAVRLFRETNS
jgi:DNA-directed RNA polymerase subunit RPC12/RpoP